MPLGKSGKKKEEQKLQEELTQKTMEKIHTLSSSRNWYLDRHERLTVQRNVLFLLFLIIMILQGLSVYMVAELNKRKVFEPFVIEVEDKTGIVTQVTTKNYERYTSDEVVIRYFVAKYIKARESYHPITFSHNYNQVVRLMSSPNVYSAFRRFISGENPESPMRLGRGIVRNVKIKSLTFLNRDQKKMQVRIVLHDAAEGIAFTSNQGQKTHYIITLQYDFLRLEMSQNQRYINPLGFQVVGYVREQENIR